jgi:transposase-like protein
MKRYTKKMFESQFPNDDACLDFIKVARWPEGISCPKCEKVTEHYRVRSRKVYECTAGTIFHKSPTPLQDWFYAIFLVASTRTGISAKQLERELGVTYKTAWRMFRQIRSLMGEGTLTLTGEVEADETYIGGKRPGKPGRGAGGKTPAFGLAQRKGSVKPSVVKDVKARTLLPLVWKSVPAYEGYTVHTDELASYHLLRRLGYQHTTIRHNLKEWVRGAAHTNTIEGFWSLVKRGISGVYHSVSPKYLQSYLDEYSYRYNRRRSEKPMFLHLLAEVPAKASQSAAMPS